MTRSPGLVMILPRIAAKLYRSSADLLSTTFFRIACRRFGAFSRVQRNVYIASPKLVDIGRFVLVTCGTRMVTESSTGELTICDGAQINADVLLDHTGGLVIGSGALISEQALIYTHDHGLDPRSAPRPVKKSIGANAWIGARAIVLPACELIGEGAVIGAGSVVTRNVAAGTVVAGNPARLVRRLDENGN